MRKKICALITVAGLLFSIVANTMPANATDLEFQVCVDENCETDIAVGDIAWLNRTATISGWVGHGALDATWSATVVFDAFAGTTKVDTQTRTVRPPDRTLNYGFTIGDPNLVGGIDRIRIQVISYYPGGPFYSPQQNYWR
jgi:hypothetical protein